MRCELSWHKGNREVHVLKTFFWKGEWITGCRQCTFGIVPSVSTEKREIVSRGTHKTYSISAAHRRDIRMRRSAPDLSHVYYDKRGTKPDISKSVEFNHEMAAGMDKGVDISNVGGKDR